VYTWFKSPVSDDDDLLCYEGVIDNKTLFVFSISYNLVVRLIAGVSYEYNIII